MATSVTFDDIVRFLRKEGWTFAIGETDSIALTVRGSGHSYSLLIRYPWEKEIIAAYVEYPFRVPPEKSGVMLDLAARINLGLLFAACEYDRDRGIIRFRSVMLTDDAPFHEEQFSTMLAASLSIAERYAPVFEAALDGAGTEEAVSLAGNTTDGV